MPSEPLIALALSLLISLAPFLPAAEKSAPEEEPAPAVEEQPALSAAQLAALAQTPCWTRCRSGRTTTRPARSVTLPTAPAAPGRSSRCCAS